MRTILTLLAGAAALAAVPASAQLAGAVGGTVGATVNTATGAATLPLPPVDPVPQASARTSADVSASTRARVDTRTVTGTAGNVVGRTERVTNRVVDRTQGYADATTRRLGRTDLRLATGTQVTGGAVVRDIRGQRIGTVANVSGNTALVVSGNRTYSVPLSSLYYSTTRTANGLVSAIPRAQLSSKVNVRASSRSAVN